ncbi:hypothetical protein GOODEAATRI_033447 [Goodea atripinnis]|uniref:Uncharacterized protein n=1 Tax=Goodea atripinnis TaxID=208336 RepID=A0ABV0P004_9TELE
MQKLHINIVSTETGMKVMVEEFTILIVHGSSQPHYYWSLDLGPTPTARDLLRKTREKQTFQQTQYMPDTELHVTMRYKNTPGPDYQYDSVFHRENNQTVTIQHLYVDPKTGKSSASVLLSGKQLQLFKGHTPHLSLTKPIGGQWKNSEHFVQRAERGRYEASTSSDWKVDHNTGIWKLTLGWVIKVHPKTHLDEAH